MCVTGSSRQFNLTTHAPSQKLEKHKTEFDQTKGLERHSLVRDGKSRLTDEADE